MSKLERSRIRTLRRATDSVAFSLKRHSFIDLQIANFSTWRSDESSQELAHGGFERRNERRNTRSQSLQRTTKSNNNQRALQMLRFTNRSRSNEQRCARTRRRAVYASESIRDDRISLTMVEESFSCRLKIDSITASSVLVVSSPQKAARAWSDDSKFAIERCARYDEQSAAGKRREEA